MLPGLSVRLAAGFVLAASARTIRFVDKDVIVARGANHAVNRLVEDLVTGRSGMSGAALFA
jgi:hypothetical protein